MDGTIGHKRRRGRWIAIVLVTMLTISACTSDDAERSPVGGDAADTASDRPAPEPGDGILLGVSSPFEEDRNLRQRIDALEAEVIGRPFGAVRVYRRWDEPFPTDSERGLAEHGTRLVLSVSTQRLDGSWIPWSSIAGAEPGDPLFEDLQAWGRSLDAVDGPITVTLDHEPDFYRNGGDGQPADYRAAYATFHDVLRDTAPDVQLTWIGVAFFFADGRESDAREYFPGPDLVDSVGADGFNWYTCRNDPGSWRTFTEIFSDFRTWAQDTVPDLPLVLAEVGTVEDLEDPARKSRWLREAADAMETPEWGQLWVITLWDNVHEDDLACDFRLQSSPRAERALAAIAARDVFAGV